MTKDDEQARRDEASRVKFYDTVQTIADALRDGGSLLSWDINEVLSSGTIYIHEAYDDKKLIATVYVTI